MRFWQVVSIGGKVLGFFNIFAGIGSLFSDMGVGVTPWNILIGVALISVGIYADTQTDPPNPWGS